MNTARKERIEDRADSKAINRQRRIKHLLMPHTAGRRWSTPHRKFEFLVAAREEEIAAKQSEKHQTA